MNKKIILGVLIATLLTGCGSNSTAVDDGVVMDEVVTTTSEVATQATSIITTTEPTIGESISDEEVTLITEPMALKEVSAMNKTIRYKLGYNLLVSLNEMRLTGDTTKVIEATNDIYRWLFEQYSFTTDNFNLEEDRNVVYASSLKDEMYITAESFYLNYCNAKTIQDKDTLTPNGIVVDVPKTIKDLIGVYEIFITTDVVNAQYQAENEIVEFIPNDATAQNDYKTYLNNLTKEDGDTLINSVRTIIETSAFTNGLTRTGSLDQSILVNKFEFNKIDVKRYYNYYYEDAYKQFEASQGSLNKPIGLQSFGYSFSTDSAE